MDLKEVQLYCRLVFDWLKAQVYLGRGTQVICLKSSKMPTSL